MPTVTETPISSPESYKTVLVAGGAGFIGSNLCRHLLQDPFNLVICLDDFSTGREVNIANLRNNSRFSVINWDITEIITPDMAWYLFPIGIEQIYHMACPASPIQYGKEPIKTIHTNYTGTLNLLKLAQQYKSRFLLSSTSETYGEPLEHPQKETYRGNVNTMGPRACYDEGKRIAETLTYEYNRQHGVDVRIVRIFNTYGPNLSPDDGRVISNFLVQALNNEPITIYGDGLQTRCFCYVDDLIDGLIRLMNIETHDESLSALSSTSLTTSTSTSLTASTSLTPSSTVTAAFSVSSLLSSLIQIPTSTPISTLTSTLTPIPISTPISTPTPTPTPTPISTSTLAPIAPIPSLITVNLGSDVEFTVIELAKLIIKLTKSQSKIIYKDLPTDDPTRRCPDISRAKNLLNWQPTTSLIDGLKNLIH